jgi:hypothetical protein
LFEADKQSSTTTSSTDTTAEAVAGSVEAVAQATIATPFDAAAGVGSDAKAAVRTTDPLQLSPQSFQQVDEEELAVDDTNCCSPLFPAAPVHVQCPVAASSSTVAPDRDDGAAGPTPARLTLVQPSTSKGDRTRSDDTDSCDDSEAEVGTAAGSKTAERRRTQRAVISSSEDEDESSGAEAANDVVSLPTAATLSADDPPRATLRKVLSSSDEDNNSDGEDDNSDGEVDNSDGEVDNSDGEDDNSDGDDDKSENNHPSSRFAARIKSFYRKHAEGELDRVDIKAIAAKFEGREDVLFAKLEKKYEVAASSDDEQEQVEDFSSDDEDDSCCSGNESGEGDGDGSFIDDGSAGEDEDATPVSSPDTIGADSPGWSPSQNSPMSDGESMSAAIEALTITDTPRAPRFRTPAVLRTSVVVFEADMALRCCFRAAVAVLCVLRVFAALLPRAAVGMLRLLCSVPTREPFVCSCVDSISSSCQQTSSFTGRNRHPSRPVSIGWCPILWGAAHTVLLSEM